MSFNIMNKWSFLSVFFLFVLFPKSAFCEKTVKELLDLNQFQEAIWAASDSDPEQVPALKEKLFQILNSDSYTISNRVIKDKPTIKVIMLPHDVEAVFKFGGTLGSRHPMSEVAAYNLDQLFKFNIVPMTIYRSLYIDGESISGSLQYFVKGTAETGHLNADSDIYDYLQREGKGAALIQYRLMLILDAIIYNLDRYGNWLFLKDPVRVVAIDNENSLKSPVKGRPILHDYLSEDLEKAIPYLQKTDPDLLDTILSVSDEKIREKVSPYCTAEAMEQLLRRMELVRAKIRDEKQKS